MHALEREHSQYEHKTYYPIAVAANDDKGEAFVGVAWEYKSLQGAAKDRWDMSRPLRNHSGNGEVCNVSRCQLKDGSAKSCV